MRVMLLPFLEMAKLGCVVRAFDPNVEMPKKYKDVKNLHYEKLGLSNTVGKLKNGAPDGSVRNMPVVTLAEAMKMFNDQNKEITYLKLDVEGAEFYALPEMVKSGVFNNIRQMGIEMHTGSRNLKNPKIVQKHLNASLMVFKELQETYGFRLIAYNANGCMGKFTLIQPCLKLYIRLLHQPYVNEVFLTGQNLT